MFVSSPFPEPEGHGEDSSSYTEAYQKAVLRLTKRLYTEKQTVDHLTQLGYPRTVVTLVVEKLKTVHLVNDEHFAGAWVRTKNRERHQSKRALLYELTKLGIDTEIAATAVEENITDTEIDRATALAGKLLRRVARYPELEGRKKLVNVIMRRGYSYSVAVLAVNFVYDETITS